MLGDHMYQRIRDLREDRDLTQAEMAQILYCSQQRDIPTKVLISLAKYHQTTTDYLLGLTNYRGIPKEYTEKSE